MKIKICGLNPTRDVQLCIDLKVDFLGFVFYEKSPRNLNLEEIKNYKTTKRKAHYLSLLLLILAMSLLKKIFLKILIIFNYMDQKPKRE